MEAADKTTSANQQRSSINGRKALEVLAETYQQLYLRPGKDSIDAYSKIVLRGEDAPKKDLSHFITSDTDSLVYESTPAGVIPVLTLCNRADFELFLQIISNRCMPCEIPVTQGAEIIEGLSNWKKIKQHRDDFIKSEMQKGNILPDWSAEFRRFTADKSNYTDSLIVLSNGPYSNISAERFELSEEKWIAYSHIIRKVHECTHFVCRRKYPQKVDAVWDELVADAVGIFAAFGKFDIDMEEAFLGIQDGSYIGGRLQNYSSTKDIQELTQIVHKVLCSFIDVFSLHTGTSPYDMAISLEENKEVLWDHRLK